MRSRARAVRSWRRSRAGCFARRAGQRARNATRWASVRPRFHRAVVKSQEVKPLAADGRVHCPGPFRVGRKPQTVQRVSQDVPGRVRRLLCGRHGEEVSSPGELHSQALSEPDVRLSTRPAPLMPPQTGFPGPSAQRTAAPAGQSPPPSVPLVADAGPASCTSAGPTAPGRDSGGGAPPRVPTGGTAHNIAPRRGRPD